MNYGKNKDDHKCADYQAKIKLEAEKVAIAEGIEEIKTYAKEEEVKKKLRTCSKCQHGVYKEKGCNHMTCISRCRHEFCFLCGATWTDKGCPNKCPKFTNWTVYIALNFSTV